MGWNKLSEYTRGRDDGLALAWKIIQESGVEGLKKELNFRKITGIHTNMMMKEVDQFTEPYKKLMAETMQVCMVAALHDEFGFGQKRCQRAMSAVDKLTTYINEGWLHWVDVMQDIKNRLNLELEDVELKKNPEKYYHPEPEDVYYRSSLVDEDDWKACLKALGFTEKPEDEDGHCIFDENRRPLFHYQGPYGKMQMIDFLSGMLFEKNGRRYDESENRTA